MRGSNYRTLAEKVLVFWICGRLHLVTHRCLNVMLLDRKCHCQQGVVKLLFHNIYLQYCNILCFIPFMG